MSDQKSASQKIKVGVLVFFALGLLVAAYMVTRPTIDDLTAACHYGSVEEVGKIARSGLDVNQQDMKMRTPLVAAAMDSDRNRATEKAKILLAAEADPKIETGGGYTALHEAARNAQTGMVKLLIEAGADVNWLSVHRQTPLVLASYHQKNWPDGVQREIVKMLLDAGAVYHVKGAIKKPLDYGYLGADADVLEMLIEARGLPRANLDSGKGLSRPPRLLVTVSDGGGAKYDAADKYTDADDQAYASIDPQMEEALPENIKALPFIKGDGLLKSSRLTGLESEKFASLLTQMAAADNHKAQKSFVDDVLLAWAETSGLAPTIAERQERSGIEIHQYDTPWGDVPWENKLFVIGACNGRYMLDLNCPLEDNTRITVDWGTSEHIEEFNRVYKVLQRRVYEAVAMQTRMAPMLDLIKPGCEYTSPLETCGGDDASFEKIEAHFKARLESNQAQGLYELLDFLQAGRSFFKPFDWIDGYVMAFDFISASELTPELKAIYEEFELNVPETAFHKPESRNIWRNWGTLVR